MTTHTPGPWIAQLTDAPLINGQTIGGPTGNILAGDGRTGGDWIATVKPFSDQFYANARLIAAAPELLEACKRLVQMFSPAPSVVGRDILAQGKAAVAKATATP